MTREPHLARSTTRLLLHVNAMNPAGVCHGTHHWEEEWVSCAGCEREMRYTVRVCALYIVVSVNTVLHNLGWTCYSLRQILPNHTQSSSFILISHRGLQSAHM